MKKVFLIISAIILSGSLVHGQSSNEFTVDIFQNDKKIEVDNYTATIKAKDFDIVFTFNKPTDLLISATFDSTTFHKAINGVKITELDGYEHTGMAEGVNNSELNMFLNNSAPSAWYYDDEEKNRFNITEKINGQIKCTRTVKSLFDVNTRQDINLEDVDKPIYMVFISYKYDRDTGRNEFHREVLIINMR